MLRALRLAKGLGLVTALAVVLSLTAPDVSEAGGGTKVISQSGTFRNGVLRSVSKSTSSTGNTDCRGLFAVIIHVSEGDIDVRAKCNNQEVAVHDGDGDPFSIHEVPTPNTFTGKAECVARPDSNTGTVPFSFSCVFLFE